MTPRQSIPRRSPGRGGWAAWRQQQGYLETAARHAVAVTAAIYVLGFLVVSLYHARYGVISFGMLQSKAIAAGSLLAFFVALALLIANGVNRILRRRPRHGLISAVAWNLAPNLFTAAMLAAFLAGEGPGPFWTYLPIILVPFVMTLVDRFKNVGVRRATSVVVLIASVALFAYFTRGAFRAIWLWLTFVAVCASLMMSTGEIRQVFVRQSDPLTPVVVAIALVGIFSQSIYGRVLPEYGGGRPMTIKLVLSQVSLWKGNTIKGKLLDEHEHGYYLLMGDERLAFFVPRAAVEAVHFRRLLSDTRAE